MSIQAAPFAPVDLAGRKVSFQSSQARDLTSYWFELARSANGLPTRTAFDPIAIPHLLPNILLIERLSAGTYQVRLQGTAFRERGLVDRTGEILQLEQANAGRSALYAAVDKALDTPCGMRVVGVEQNAEGKRTLIEIVSYPLTDQHGIARHIVSVILTLETIGYADDRASQYAISEIQEMTEISLDLLSPVQA